MNIPLGNIKLSSDIFHTQPKIPSVINLGYSGMITVTEFLPLWIVKITKVPSKRDFHKELWIKGPIQFL